MARIKEDKNEKKLEILNNKIENLDSKIDQKLEKIDSYMHSIDKTLVKQNADLEYHIKRTNQLEDEFLLINSKINDRLTPIEDHTKKIDTIARFVFGVLASFVALLGAYEGFEFFFN